MQSAPLICSCPWHGEGDIGRRSCMAGGRTTLFTCPYRPASMRVSPCLRLVVVISEAVIVIALQLELFDHDHGRDHEREPGVMILKGAG